MNLDDDILELIRELPAQINSPDVSPEFKFMVAGAVLWRCADEIKYLREQIEKLKASTNEKRRKGKKVRKLQTDIHRSGILS
jgi:hypothetical protein